MDKTVTITREQADEAIADHREVQRLRDELSAFAHFVSIRSTDGEVLAAANAIRRGEPFLRRDQ